MAAIAHTSSSITTANAAVMRALIGTRTGLVVSKQVSGAADGGDAVAPERPVDLLAQVRHVHRHHVQVTVVRAVPDVLGEPCPAEHLVAVPHEVLEQRE